MTLSIIRQRAIRTQKQQATIALVSRAFSKARAYWHIRNAQAL
ncbi:hypothetical protein PCI56_17045 [Plesiomonas shigelloides subsp. oncorhynchi]|nr:MULTISPECIES: hypothetical protein [Plesiomonas]MCQ8858418.1 hypothetical protein [Plesiomonas shigelloides]MCX2497663.1 hypothetical protein [Plesiomonas shigelloides]MCX2532827.1 hypothetical protein [Plesiomonas shigelloides]MDA1380999.1 hypothetical protein [Plesiomonas shigelloides]MDT1011888.1 hypothetical protein [Plesiomonas shigelloides]